VRDDASTAADLKVRCWALVSRAPGTDPVTVGPSTWHTGVPWSARGQEVRADAFHDEPVAKDRVMSQRDRPNLCFQIPSFIGSPPP
jgi:hypothetical protein